MRIVVDANLWISFLISNRLRDFVLALENHHLTLVLYEKLIKEVFSIAVRPKFSSMITEADVLFLRNIFKTFGEVVSTTSQLKICRDPLDDFLLELTVDGEADYLITGDKDLLTLKEVNEIPIVKYTDWVAQMRQSE